MRESILRDPILRNKDGKFIGFMLGAGFCAEQEWGIEKLNEALGIKDDISVYGLERRLITKDIYDLENHCVLIEGKKHSLLVIMDEDWAMPKFKENVTNDNLDRKCRGSAKEYPFHADAISVPSDKTDWEISAAWSGRDVGILVDNEKLGKELRFLYQGIIDGKVAVWLGGDGRNPFSKASLCLGIVENIDEEHLKEAYDYDKKSHELILADEKIDIKARVDKAKAEWNKKNPGPGYISPFSYMALSPRWKEDFPQLTKESEYDVIYYLNPMGEGNNSGYYSVEELELWLKGEGPVVKDKETA